MKIYVYTYINTCLLFKYKEMELLNAVQRDKNLKNSECLTIIDICKSYMPREELSHDSVYVQNSNKYVTKEHIKRHNKFIELREIPEVEQKSKEWFDMRQNMISASDIGSALDLNKKSQRFELILKKCVFTPWAVPTLELKTIGKQTIKAFEVPN